MFCSIFTIFILTHFSNKSQFIKHFKVLSIVSIQFVISICLVIFLQYFQSHLFHHNNLNITYLNKIKYFYIFIYHFRFSLFHSISICFLISYIVACFILFKSHSKNLKYSQNSLSLYSNQNLKSHFKIYFASFGTFKIFFLYVTTLVTLKLHIDMFNNSSDYYIYSIMFLITEILFQIEMGFFLFFENQSNFKKVSIIKIGISFFYSILLENDHIVGTVPVKKTSLYHSNSNSKSKTPLSHFIQNSFYYEPLDTYNSNSHTHLVLDRILPPFFNSNE